MKFIKAQFEDNPQINYAQNKYCTSANYQDSEKKQLTDLWNIMNKQLLFLFKQIISKKLLQNKYNNETLKHLIIDYISDLKHHKNLILT